MNDDDPVITRVSATNPVPDADALTAQQRATAELLRATIASTGGAPARPARRIWPAAVAFASIAPVAIVVILVLGIHHRPNSLGRHGGSAILHLPTSGSAQTLLLVGSDHRAGEPYRSANTDAMLLVRIDPSAPTINVLSVPRDLEVRIPGLGTGKVNAAYSAGGPALLLRILRTQVFPDLQVNHVIDFNFQGFSALVDAAGCVYGDIDHRYINVNDSPQSDYSGIDLQAGYQRLCGAAALQFVRFRHTDSDLVRETRQQDFLRWVSESVSFGTLLGKRDRLFEILGQYGQIDSGLQSTTGLLQLFDLAIGSAGHPVAQIPFPADAVPCSGTTGTCYLRATHTNEVAAYQRFLGTGTVAGGASGSGTSRSPAAGVVPDTADGEAQARALGTAGLPVYYPATIAGGSGYCSTATGNCRLAPNPADRYADSYPRAYTIGAGGHRYPSYRMTLVLDQTKGEYYGVQGTTWSDPPILRHPVRTEVVDGRSLREYGTGSELSLVAFSTPSGNYWVSNTLTDAIPSGELIAIAASMRPAG